MSNQTGVAELDDEEIEGNALNIGQDAAQITRSIATATRRAIPPFQKAMILESLDFV